MLSASVFLNTLGNANIYMFLYFKTIRTKKGYNVIETQMVTGSDRTWEYVNEKNVQ